MANVYLKNSMRGVSKNLKRLLAEYLNSIQTVQFNINMGLINGKRRTPEGDASLVRAKRVAESLRQTLLHLERLASRPPSIGDYVAVLSLPPQSSLRRYSRDNPGVITQIRGDASGYSINGAAWYPASSVQLIGPATEVSLGKVREFNEAESVEEISEEGEDDSDENNEIHSDPFIVADKVILDLCRPNKGMIQVQRTRTVDMPSAGVRKYYCQLHLRNRQKTLSVCIALKPDNPQDTQPGTASSTPSEPCKFPFHVSVWPTKKRPFVATEFHWSGSLQALPSAILWRLSEICSKEFQK